MPAPQRPRNRRTAPKLLATLALALSAGALAQLPDPYRGSNEWNPLDMEVANLPPYCQANLRPKQYPGPGTRAYGCGDTFNHFCPALVAMNRARNPLLSMTARRYNLSLAEDHLRYNRTHLVPQCRLVGEVQVAEHQAKLLRTLLGR